MELAFTCLIVPTRPWDSCKKHSVARERLSRDSGLLGNVKLFLKLFIFIESRGIEIIYENGANLGEVFERRGLVSLSWTVPFHGVGGAFTYIQMHLRPFERIAVE